MRPFVILCATLLLLTPSTVLSGQDEVVALRQQVQQLQAELIRVKADAYDRIVRLEETIRQANTAIQGGAGLVSACRDSTLKAEFKKLGYPVK